MTDKQSATQETIAGLILLIVSILSLAIIIHHPTLGTPGHDNLAEEAVVEARLNGFVHGALIIANILFYFALTILSDQLGCKRLAVRAAQLSFATATISMIGAALVSGFIVPDLAAHLVQDQHPAAFPTQLKLLGAMNQTFAKTGVIGYGFAIFFWSSAFLRFSGVTRIIGIYGLTIGIVFIAGILSSHLVLDVTGITQVLAAMILWFIAIAVQMIRTKV